MREEITTDYSRLLEKYREMAILSSASGILGWDMMTKMPPKGINLRSQQLALLSGISHRMATDPAIGALLERLEQSQAQEQLDSLQKRNLHLIRKGYDEQAALPESLVTEMQRQSSLANNIWAKAKAANDWKMFLPELEKNVELAQKSAEILMRVKKTATPYDALIDIYEPGMKADYIDRLFRELREGLIPLIDKIRRSAHQPDEKILKVKVPVENQRKLAVALAENLHYNVTSEESGGRIDETEHPFTTGYYDDVRITTHYYEEDFASSVFSVLHESGHALYEQQLQPEWIYQPVGTACSTGVHESQSRLVENMVGRCAEFWTYFLPKLKELTGNILAGVSQDEFVRAVNRVVPSKVRIEADEVTYSLHVIIRFNLEKDLFAGKIEVKDLPELWNQSYRDYLGVKIENYSEGILQDMHWSAGNFGYFPCYALGNIYSGQMLDRMSRDIPEWPRELEKGNFLPVKEWLFQKVHREGNLYDPPELIRRITGREITVEPYLQYLNDKYARLYRF